MLLEKICQLVGGESPKPTHRADVDPVTGEDGYEPKHAAWRWNA